MNNLQRTFPAIETKTQINDFIDNWWTVIWVDVDTQYDFVKEWWNLYVPSNPGVIKNISDLSNNLRVKIWSVDSHAFDAWEFQSNWWPFPAHCQKWSKWWLKIKETQSEKTRFIPMSRWELVIWESNPWEWNRSYWAKDFAKEILEKWVLWIFEKEVYSLFANPNADPFLRTLIETAWWVDKVFFAVFWYCTWEDQKANQFCVWAAAQGLRERDYNVAIIDDATTPIWWEQGAQSTRKMCKDNNIHVLPTKYLIKNN